MGFCSIFISIYLYLRRDIYVFSPSVAVAVEPISLKLSSLKQPSYCTSQSRESGIAARLGWVILLFDRI